MTIVCVPGVSGCKSATQPAPTDRPSPGVRPENVVHGQDDVQQWCLHQGHRHGLTVDGDGGYSQQFVPFFQCVLGTLP